MFSYQILPRLCASFSPPPDFINTSPVLVLQVVPFTLSRIAFQTFCAKLSVIPVVRFSSSSPSFSAFQPPMDSCSSTVRGDSFSPFDCLMFDLDDTLYPSNLGINEACKKNIDAFLIEKCGFPASKATALRVELFKSYGSTLAGLRALGYDIDADDYHGVVHGRLPYDRIKPDPQLRNLLRSTAQRKIIFTNSDRIHAVKVLDRLGLKDCFDQIICFETMNPNLANSARPDEFPVVLKPSIEAMKIAIEAAEIDPRRTLFLDDNMRNVAAGKVVGLRTVLVGKTVKIKEADYVLENVNNLPQAISEGWVGGKDGGNTQRIGRTRSDIEVDSVLTTVGA